MDPPVFHVTITSELAGPGLRFAPERLRLAAGIRPDDPFGNGFALRIRVQKGGPSPFGERFAFAPAFVCHRALF